MSLSSPQTIERIFLYGPPGSGKSSLGRQLAQDLSFKFIDLDQVIESQAGMPVKQIFAVEGETGFRQRESRALGELVLEQRCVIALGGGALLREENRRIVEAHGQVLCLSAPLPVLFSRLSSDQTPRPLIAGDAAQKYKRLMESREAHYASFALQMDTSKTGVVSLSRQAQRHLGLFRVVGMQAAYDVRVYPGSLAFAGEWLKLNGLGGPIAVVTDEHVASHYLQAVLDSIQVCEYSAHPIVLPAGESHKTMDTVMALWERFLQAGLDRSSTVLALGGGVVGDLAGFAAASFLRGVNWVAVPTSLLAMVDASLGGKTGVDLPQGKNLVGAFHAPRLVLADPLVLQTLPDAEICNGMAEVLKHGVIGDPGLLDSCRLLYYQGILPGKTELLGDSRSPKRELSRKNAQGGFQNHALSESWSQDEMDSWTGVVRRAMAVKIDVILDDPFEKGRRASLNLGHTLGHAVEKVSSYQVKHGEAVAIGTLAALRAAVRMGLASPHFYEELSELFDLAGLPTRIPPDLKTEALFAALSYDKKRKAGSVRFVLPIQPGEVHWGVEIPDLQYLLEGRSNE